MKFGHQIILANSNLQSALPELVAGKHFYHRRPSFAIRVFSSFFHQLLSKERKSSSLKRVCAAFYSICEEVGVSCFEQNGFYTWAPFLPPRPRASHRIEASLSLSVSNLPQMAQNVLWGKLKLPKNELLLIF